MLDLRVDAYTATVQDNAQDCIEWLVQAVPEREQIQVGREGALNRWKYDHAVGVQDGKTLVAAVRWGGNGEGISIELKGSIANETYGLLRARYSDHSCSRMDVALDRSAVGLFELAHARLLSIAQGNNPRISTEPKGKGWDQPGVYGRTKYFGTRESDAHAMLYEKGFERVERGGLEAQEVDLNWVRYETSVHPAKREHKALLASMTPAQAVGWKSWLASMYSSFSGLPAQAVDLPRRESDDERTYAALLHQYGRFIERKAGLSPGDFIDQVLSDLITIRRRRSGAL